MTRNRPNAAATRFFDALESRMLMSADMLGGSQLSGGASGPQEMPTAVVVEANTEPVQAAGQNSSHINVYFNANDPLNADSGASRQETVGALKMVDVKTATADCGAADSTGSFNVGGLILRDPSDTQTQSTGIAAYDLSTYMDGDPANQSPTPVNTVNHATILYAGGEVD